jgi:hypothetical protein
MTILDDWKYTYCLDCLIYKKLSEMYPSEYYLDIVMGHLQIYRRSNHENISHEIAHIISITRDIIKEFEHNVHTGT